MIRPHKALATYPLIAATLVLVFTTQGSTAQEPSPASVGCQSDLAAVDAQLDELTNARDHMSDVLSAPASAWSRMIQTADRIGVLRATLDASQADLLKCLMGTAAATNAPAASYAVPAPQSPTTSERRREALNGPYAKLLEPINLAIAQGSVVAQASEELCASSVPGPTIGGQDPIQIQVAVGSDAQGVLALARPTPGARQLFDLDDTFGSALPAGNHQVLWLVIDANGSFAIGMTTESWPRAVCIPAPSISQRMIASILLVGALLVFLIILISKTTFASIISVANETDGQRGNE